MTFTRNGVYRPRWQVWYPWSVTRWWLPQLPERGGDEWCNDSVIIKLWFLGAIVVFWRLRRRVLPCPEEWAAMMDDQRADYAPCGYYWNGRINERGHRHWDTGMCEQARKWLDLQDQICEGLEAGVQAGQGLVSGIKASLDSVDSAMKSLASAMVADKDG